jgi:hypothetical protein
MSKKLSGKKLSNAIVSDQVVSDMLVTEPNANTNAISNAKGNVNFILEKDELDKLYSIEEFEENFACKSCMKEFKEENGEKPFTKKDFATYLSNHAKICTECKIAPFLSANSVLSIPDTSNEIMTETQLAAIVFPDAEDKIKKLEELKEENEEGSQELENEQDTSKEELLGEKKAKLIEEFLPVEEEKNSIIDILKSEEVVSFSNMKNPKYKYIFYLMIQEQIILKELKNIMLFINKRIDDTGIQDADKSIYKSYVKIVCEDISKLVSTYHSDARIYKEKLKNVLADVLSILEISQEISDSASQASPNELPKGSAIPGMIKGKKDFILSGEGSEEIKRLLYQFSNPETYPYVYTATYILEINIKFFI